MSSKKKQTNIATRPSNKSGIVLQPSIKTTYIEKSYSDYKDNRFDWCLNTKYLCHQDERFDFCKVSKENFLAICKKIDDYRGWTWSTIKHSYNGTSTGHMEVWKLEKDIRDMVESHFKRLEIQEDEIIKIEISNAHRIWGIDKSGIFYVIWNDDGHYFYKHKNKDYTPPKN
jgi:hypothetical protein